MKYEEFKDEMNKQIGLNASFFKPKEVQTLYDFIATIQEKDFDSDKAEPRPTDSKES